VITYAKENNSTKINSGTFCLASNIYFVSLPAAARRWKWTNSVAGMWSRSPSTFAWLEPEPKIFRWWSRSRRL